ncbi:MAG: peptide chain release factor N(5)-glutamine methyltransferase [Candidatus Zophobacter franzmannii]|nr:peptide chain release factor N(5)-glutamine methyltransferase [Candidatus Zophobacter franzmannii]
MQSLLETLNQGIAILQKAETENPFLEAELLLEQLVKIPRLELSVHCFDPIDKKKMDIYFELINRRAKFEPVQYILGETQFLDFTIKVTPDVLIPRPETELLVDYIKHDYLKPQRILDIGTGSGAIAIALKSLFPDAEVIASDISSKALDIALENAELNKQSITFIESDLFSAVEGKFDLIVSNPPYISAEDYAKLPIEVKEFEPETALLAEENGLICYRQILSKAKGYLNEKGVLFFEIGEKQATLIEEIAREYSFSDIDIYQDLCDKDRYIKITNSKNEFENILNLLK